MTKKNKSLITKTICFAFLIGAVLFIFVGCGRLQDFYYGDSLNNPIIKGGLKGWDSHSIFNNQVLKLPPGWQWEEISNIVTVSDDSNCVIAQGIHIDETRSTDSLPSSEEVIEKLIDSDIILSNEWRTEEFPNSSSIIGNGTTASWLLVDTADGATIRLIHLHLHIDMNHSYNIFFVDDSTEMVQIAQGLGYSLLQ